MSGFLGRRSSTGGSLPDLTSSASAGASLYLVVATVGSVVAVGPAVGIGVGVSATPSVAVGWAAGASVAVEVVGAAAGAQEAITRLTALVAEAIRKSRR